MCGADQSKVKVNRYICSNNRACYGCCLLLPLGLTIVVSLFEYAEKDRWFPVGDWSSQVQALPLPAWSSRFYLFRFTRFRGAVSLLFMFGCKVGQVRQLGFVNRLFMKLSELDLVVKSPLSVIYFFLCFKQHPQARSFFCSFLNLALFNQFELSFNK